MLCFFVMAGCADQAKTSTLSDIPYKNKKQNIDKVALTAELELELLKQKNKKELLLKEK